MTKTYFLLAAALLCSIAGISQCPTVINVSPASGCGIYELVLNEFGDNGNIIWTYDGGQPLATGVNGVMWASDIPGTHEICAEAWTAACPNGVTICTSIDVPQCNTLCPLALLATEVDCDSYVFYVDGFANGEVLWSFDDGEPFFGSVVTEHTFTTNGIHVVNATYYGPNCQLGTTLILTVNVDCVTNDCPTEIWSGAGDGCGIMNFEIGSFVQGESVVWYPGDESGAVTGGHFFSHQYALPGNYQVCAFYTTPLCPNGVELCTDITVLPCNVSNCPTNIIAQEVDCNTYVFTIDGVIEGNVFWSFGDGSSYNGGVIAEHSYTSDGLNIVTAEYFGPNCQPGTTLIYTVIVDCGTNTDCPTEIWSGAGDGCGIMNFEIGSFVQGESVVWYPGDESGAVTGGHFFSHQYALPGNYQVCAFYTTPLCPNGVELCTDITVLPCNVSNCPTNIIAQEVDCNTYVFTIDGVTEGNVYWSFGDGGSYNAGVIAEHSYTTDGVNIVTAEYFGPNCQSGTTIIYTVVVDCGTNTDCPTEIWSGAGDGCGVMNFEIGSFVQGESVVWYPGDESGPVTGGHFFSHQYDQPGEYQVCAYYTSPICPNGVELCVDIFVTGCDEICPTEIIITPVNCHQYIFSVNEWGNSLYGDILWNFGDNEGYGQNEFLHMYMDPGNYEVCVSGTTATCPSGFEICTPHVVEACGDSDNNGCPDYIWGYPLNDCGLWYFEAGDLDNPDQQVTWNWGDGTSSDGGTIMEHQYETDGLYVVTMTYISSNCNQLITLNFTLEANACETPDCPQEIWSGPGTECGVMNFEAGGFVEGEQFVWTFGDGTTAEGGHFITHQYDEPGAYVVCCVLSNINCPGYQLCTEIIVEPCELPCTEAVLGIDSYINQGGTPWLVYSIIGVNGTDYSTSGEVTYTESDPYFDTALCLPDGCYYLTIDNNNNIAIGQGLNLFLTSGDVNYLENYEIIYQDNISFTIMFGVNSDCTNTGNCEASFTPIYTNTAGHIEFQNTSVYDGTATFSWDYGNGAVSDVQSGNVWYETNGIYEVCLTITTDNCTDTYCYPVSVQDMTTGCDDNLVVVTVNSVSPLNITELVEIALSFDELQLDVWSLPITTGFSASYEMCIPDGCYEVTINSEVPLQSESVVVTVTSGDQTIDVMEFLNNSTSETFTFGLNSDCVTGLENDEEVLTWNIFPNPASSQVEIQTNMTNDILDIAVFDAHGRLVLKQTPNTMNTLLDTGSLSSGLYLIKITGTKHSEVHRLEIQH